MQRPRVSHMQAVKRILRYLKGSIDLGLWFSKCSTTPSIQALSDADWAGSSLDRRSTGGYCIFLNNSLISLRAKKQPTVVQSSTEAEYRSLANIAAKITWICKLLIDIAYPLPSSPRLWCDNVFAISLAKNPIFHAWTKHVEIDYHYICENVLANQVSVQFVCTQDQIADISGGATVGSSGSHDPWEAMKITLELHLRPLGGAHHLFDKMGERRSKAARQEEEFFLKTDWAKRRRWKRRWWRCTDLRRRQWWNSYHFDHRNLKRSGIGE